MILLTGYSATLRAAVLDRVEQLEAERQNTNVVALPSRGSIEGLVEVARKAFVPPIMASIRDKLLPAIQGARNAEAAQPGLLRRRAHALSRSNTYNSLYKRFYFSPKFALLIDQK